MTQNTQNTGVKLMGRVNYEKKITGWLAHDNRMFDRTCPNCKGMYSSFESAVCPKCGSQLTYITIAAGQAMCISEGTIYEALTTKQKERDAKATKSRKGGMMVIHRFKMFSFADENGILNVPELHNRCKKGAMIEVRIVNHKELVKPFQVKKTSQFVQKGEWMVELMLQVFPQYGDSVTILAGPKAKGDVMVNQRVNAAGTAMPVQTPTPLKDNAPAELAAQLAALQAQLATITNAVNGMSAQPAAPTVPVSPIHQAWSMSAAIAAELLNDYEPSFSEQEDFNDEEVDPFDV